MIFASVVLALLADDWRAGRVDRAEEREFLALLASDLAADADGFRVHPERLDGQEQAAQRLVGLLEAGAPAESVVIALRGATQLYNFRRRPAGRSAPSRAAGDST